MAATQGLLTDYSLANEKSTYFESFLREVFINEAPLFSRVPVKEIGAADYKINTYNVRPRTYTLNAAFTASAGSTGLTLTDGSPLMVGDILEVLDTAGTASERVEITTVTSTTVFVMRRAREGTTVIANTAGGSAGSLVVTLIGNSRTGAEINQAGLRMTPTQIDQYVQTFQTPVEVGGLANALTNVALPPGQSTVYDAAKELAYTNFVRDVEYTSYFGKGETAAAIGDRRKQKGLRALITSYASGTNVTLAGGASYTKLNFVAQGPQKALDGGGQPDVCICSTNFLTGLATWSVGLQQFPQPRMTSLGLPIEEYFAPFVGKPMTFIPSYQLPAGTAICLTSKDVRFRRIRPAFWQERGKVGDAMQGEFIGDYCIEVGHPEWHAWIGGITSFA